MGPFLLLINWSLVKYKFMKFLMEPWVYFLWDPSYFSLTEIWSNLCSWNPYGAINEFLMGPFLLLINWSLVKCLFMKSLWDRVCISYGTLHITHKNWTLVKSVFMKSLWDRVCISYGTLPITHKLNFGQICVHKILMEPSGYFLWDPSYYS